MDYKDTMKFMAINIWIHHMQIDEMFDYLSGRVDTPPPYWYNHEECPYTVTGGYTKISIPYGEFTKLRSERDWEDHFTSTNPVSRGDDWSSWDKSLRDDKDLGFDDHADFIDL
jgi:hypothetical protein